MSMEHAEALASKEGGQVCVLAWLTMHGPRQISAAIMAIMAHSCTNPSHRLLCWQMTEAAAAELEALRVGSKDLHEGNAELKFLLQQKEVEYGQLQLQLEKSVMAKAAEAQGHATNAEETMTQLHADIVQLESELKKERRVNKERETELHREASRITEINLELTQGRERLKAADRRFREQVKEHMDDLARLTAAATPRAEQLNSETRKLIDTMAAEIQVYPLHLIRAE